MEVSRFTYQDKLLPVQRKDRNDDLAFPYIS